MTKIECATVDEIEQAARSAHHDISSPAQRAELMVVADATVNREHPGMSARRCGGKIGSDLACQLAGALRSTGLGELGVVALIRNHDPLQQCDTERQGLAGTRTRLADHVSASQRDGHGHGLDRERRGDADFIECLDDRIDHAEIGEAGRWEMGHRAIGPGRASCVTVLRICLNAC